jgi:small conductance mechanosensitive channel
MSGLWERVTEWVVAYGGQVLGAVVILIAGFVGARIVRRIVRRLLSNRNVAPAIVGFASKLSYAAILVFAVIASLAKFGVQTTSFVAILGAAGFAVGFALQGSLANFAAGVLILILRPYKIGDFIVAAGQMGTVKDIQLFTTVLATPDNVKVLVPNGKLFGDTITNYSVFETRRLDLPVGIAYDASIDRARDVLMKIAHEDARVADDPAPQAMVSELADSSVNLLLRIWIDRNDYWAVKFDLTGKIKQAFDEAGIEIPFPQRVIHMPAGAKGSGA